MKPASSAPAPSGRTDRGAPDRSSAGAPDRGPEDAGVRRVLRSLAMPIYVPTVLEASGEAALLPVVPLLALRLGFSVPAAAALTMIAGIAAVLGPIPVGRMMSAVGARRAIIASGVLLAASNVGALFVVGDGLTAAPHVGHRAALIGLLVVMAGTSQVWQLGRQSYLGTELPPRMRARGMTTFGGMMRVGQVIGPLLGAGVMALGHEAWVFGLFAAMTAAATTLVATFMVPGESRGTAPSDAEIERAEAEVADPAVTEAEGEVEAAASEAPPGSPRAAAPPVREVLARMVRVGLGVTPIMMGRINRPVIVPLIGASLDLPATVISVVFGVAAVIEILMFIPAGSIMDRRGRAAVAVPCSILMGLGFLLLAVLAPTLGTSSRLGAFLALTLPSLLIALGNGLGSGIVMTLGIDVSPESDRTRYLSWWNTVIGVGRLTAPLLVSGIALVAPVVAAAGVSGGLCLAGAWWLGRALRDLEPSGR